MTTCRWFSRLNGFHLTVTDQPCERASAGEGHYTGHLNPGRLVNE